MPDIVIVNTYSAEICIGRREKYTDVLYDFTMIESIVQNYVNTVKLCVTITKTMFVYVDGREEGVFIRLINYPRFPSTNVEIYNKALELANILKQALNQYRVSIIFPDKTIMI